MSQLTKHDTTSLHCVQALPHHGADRAASHVGDKAAEESLAGEVGVVLLQVLHGCLHHLHGHQLETLLLKARNDLANKAALDAVRLDHDEGALLVAHLGFGGGCCGGCDGLAACVLAEEQMEECQESREHQKRRSGLSREGERRDTRSGKERLCSGGKNVGLNPFIYIGEFLLSFQMFRGIFSLH